MSYVPRRTAALICASLLLVVTGCSGDDPADDPEDEGEDLGARLATAKTQIDEAPSIDFTIRTDQLPSGVSGLLEAEGTGTSEPAFDGMVRVSPGPIDAEVISVDDTVYAKVGFTPAFLEVEPSTLNAPDPADFFDPETGVSSLLVATEDPQAGEDERDGEDVLTTVTGTLPGEPLAALLPTADEAGQFDVSYRLTEDDLLRGATITGPFYEGSDDVTYDLTVEPSDETVEITAP
jgi:lipoprotein LprG